ncbi:MAG: transcriptional regulator [Acidobacteria bacterium]|nr:MAG: transcriptional regulator [Acidobacteriota bacterium]
MIDRSQVEKISKALADETRLMIFEAISGKAEMNCGEIVELGRITPATVSHHLKILQEAGLIECHRSGQFVYSSALRNTIKEYTRALSRMARGGKSSSSRRVSMRGH